MSYRYCLAFLLVFLVSFAADRPERWAQPITGKLGNLYQVSPELYRSEQPTKSDIPQLQKLGVKSILTLREYHKDHALEMD